MTALFTQEVACPFCGSKHNHTWEPDQYNNNRVASCQDCGKFFALFWNVVAIVDARKIEGQEEEERK